MVIEKWSIDGYAILTMLLLGPFYIARDRWHFGDFCNIFLPNTGEDQILTISVRSPWEYVPYGKSGPGYCITFTERLDMA